MEKIEYAPQEPKTIEEAVSLFIEGDNSAAISFLRSHKNEIGEFCLQVRDSYAESDKTTPFLKLSMLIEELL